MNTIEMGASAGSRLHIHTTSSHSFYIIGTGGHARECAAIWEARCVAGIETNPELFLGFLDDDTAKHFTSVATKTVHGSLRMVIDMLTTSPTVRPVELVCGIGSVEVRARMSETVRAAQKSGASVRWRPQLIHPLASIGTDCRAGEGFIMNAGAILTTEIQMGRHVHLNIGSSVSHDCQIGHFVTIAPGARLAGTVHVGDRTDIGMQASVIQLRRLGSDVRIGAGAAVITDVPDTMVAVGVPARLLPRRADRGERPVT